MAVFLLFVPMVVVIGKVGKCVGGAGAEGLSYTFTIPATATSFAMLFHYAVVLNDGGHPPYQQPRLRARIVDVATGLSLIV